MSDPPADDTLTAKYQALGTITLASAPSGILLQVDSATCTTPCTLERPQGSVLKVSVPAMIQTAPNSRLLFQGWKDSGDGTRQITVAQNAQTYTLSYQQQNLLVLSATPADGASISVTPASTDGFYNAGALVSISAQLALGFRFAGWTGDLSGSALAAALTLDAPKSAGLLLDRVPTIAPGGASNAASSTAVGVTPGSLISVFGANLAPALQVGTGNPLPQMLQNVTVRVDDAFLPLIFVSPGQINAQLPSATSLGTHTVVVHWEGKPETSTQVLVARNAPGLFGDGAPDQPVGSFVRSSGQAVTTDNPAQAGEIVSVLGTGLGPYVLQPPDGFLFDETAGYTLQDGVTVVAGDQVIDAIYGGRSGAAVGVDAIRFQVPSTLPDSPFLPVKIRISGQESNTVFLPVSR
jgi:uncharacterized protein (TIGR03437 family)